MCSSTRGPAIMPSLVTCPITNTEIPEDLARSRSRLEHSRTCETDPADESISAMYTVWIESTTSSSGCSAASVLEDRFQVGFGHQVELLRHGWLVLQQAQGAHFHLALRLLTGNIQHHALFGHLQGNLQHQGGLANARVAAHQHDRAGHHPAAQHAGEFADRQGQAGFAVAFDLIQATRPRLPAQA